LVRGTVLRMTELRVRSAYLRVATRRSTPPRPVVPTTPDHHHGDHLTGTHPGSSDRARRYRPAETRIGDNTKRDTPTQCRGSLDRAASHQCHDRSGTRRTVRKTTGPWTLAYLPAGDRGRPG